MSMRVTKKRKGKATRFVPLFGPVGALLITASLHSPTLLAASPSTPTSRTEALTTQSPGPDLEERVWLSDESEFATVERDVVALLQAQPDSAFAHYLLTHLYLRQYEADPQKVGQLERAAKLAEQVMALNAQAEYGYLAMAEILDLMGKQSHAGAVLTAMEQQRVPLSWRFYFAKARLAGDTALTTQTLDLLARALDANQSKRAVIVPYMIALLQSTHSADDVYAHYQSWDQRYPHPLFKQVMAMNLSDRGHYHEAHALYTSLRQTEPSLVEAKVNDAILLYRYLGDRNLAKTLLQQSLQETHTRKADLRAVAESHLGAIALMSGDDKAASAHFVSALQQTTQTDSHVYFVVEAYRKEKRFADLGKFLVLANTEIPGRADLHAALGQVYNEDLKDHDAAVESYTNAIILDPERSEHFNNLGLAFYHLGYHTKALLAFDRAIALAPNDASALYNKACVLALLGQSNQALAYLRQAINLNPTLQKLALEDSDLATLRTIPDFLRITRENGLTTNKIKVP